MSSRTVHEGAAGAGGSSATPGTAGASASGGATGGAGTGVAGSSAGATVEGGSAGEVGSAGTSAGTGGAGASGAGGGSAGTSGAAAGGTSGAASVCGNGTVEAGETCDDHNTAPGDGCNGLCAVEVGFVCSGEPSACFKPGPSCSGLAATCGPKGKGNCCASSLVSGIATETFYRSYDGVSVGYTDKSYAAEVSDFSLDTYEVTVGRFRQFVTAYSQTMIAQGAGKNPNNPSDVGWDSSWNASLEPSSTALASAVQCDAKYQTWTANNDSLPINCLSWFEAEAFCIWDGGRLPTEAEWNYAASGGTEQRVYPWSSPATSTTIDCNHANYYGASGGADYCILPGTGSVVVVGSESPAGDGKWGQADLVGNVWEWVQDWYVTPYATTTCDNCANSVVQAYRVNRGGSYGTPASEVISSFRNYDSPSLRRGTYGARCARSAP